MGIYWKLYAFVVLAMFMLPFGDLYRFVPETIYYVPAVSFPVLTFFLFSGRTLLARAVFYTVNLSALLVIAYAFVLALYFFNHYMGPKFGTNHSPSLVISQIWTQVFIWFVVPFDMISLLIFFAGYFSGAQKTR